MKKTLIIMCGVPASGKSTVARRLQQHFDHAPIISMDDIRETKFGSRADQNHNYEVYNYSIIAVVDAFKTHDVVIYDATNRTRKARKQLVNQISNYWNFDAYCVYLATDIDIAIERNEQRSEHEKVPVSVIRRMCDSLQEPTYEEEYLKDIYKIYPETLDNSRAIVYNILVKQIKEN